MGEQVATEKQVMTLARLLVRAAGYGLEPRLAALMGNAGPNFDKLRALSRYDASRYISLLREQY